MPRIILLLVLTTFLPQILRGQNETAPSIDLLSELTQETPDLLPSRFLFTQRIFWGRKGLMRNFSRFELTPENRQKELDLRRKMLVAHQVLGFATLGAMIAQGIIGTRLYKGEYQLKDTHEMLATGVNIGYFSTAALSFVVPPKAVDERKGYSSIKVHKALALLHLSGMIATNVLADKLESDYSLRPYHRAAAFTAFGSFGLAIIIIKF